MLALQSHTISPGQLPESPVVTLSTEAPKQPSLLRSKLFWVAILYFAEGFPLGIFYDIFPVYFRQQGVELSKIGVISLLGLAWTLKFLWAPAIDYTRRHRYWMACADCAMGAVMLTFAIEAGFGPWVWLAIGTFTFLSATNDIATDGYTIEWLDRNEMGLANGFRIGFYRVGMLAAGIVLMVSEYASWKTAFITTTVMLIVLGGVMLFVPKERPRAHEQSPLGGQLKGEFAALVSQPQWIIAIALLVAGLCWPIIAAVDPEWAKPFKKLWWFRGMPVFLILASALVMSSARGKAAMDTTKSDALTKGPVFGALIEILSRPGIAPILIFILIFKLADSSMGFMIRPFWVDMGFGNAAIGMVSVNIGLGLSIAGGIAGGLYTDRVGIFKALWVLGLWQAFSNLGYWACALTLAPQAQGLPIPIDHKALMYGASAIESFTQGLGTAAFMAFLMAIVNKERAATEYAVFSGIFAFSRSVAGWAGGVGAQEMGFANYFLLTFFLAFPAYVLLGYVKRALDERGHG
jgi:MFS transporter, PAT family, beta-lactamase induction signal transducer AmpG